MSAYFSGRRYSFDKTEVDNDPGKNQTKNNLPAYGSHVRYTIRNLQNVMTELE